MGSAAATTSDSMPEDANNRSTTGACGAGERVSRTVASRPTASCSTSDPMP